MKNNENKDLTPRMKKRKRNDKVEPRKNDGTALKTKRKKDDSIQIEELTFQ